jgi:hypothetical protein
MWLLLSVWKVANETRSIDPGTAWTIIVVLGAVIGGMAGYTVVTWAKHGKEIRALNSAHATKVSEMGQKINELYDKRIEDMKETINLVATLEGVVHKERKGGK